MDWYKSEDYPAIWLDIREVIVGKFHDFHRHLSVEDIQSECYYKLFEIRNKINQDGNIRSFVIKCCINHIMGILRIVQKCPVIKSLDDVDDINIKKLI